MPTLALGVWFWLLHGRHRRWLMPHRLPRVTDPEANRPSPMTVAVGEAVTEPNRPARVPARAEVRRLLRRHGNAVTPERIAERAGVSIPHARRLLREERVPHVVGAVANADVQEAER
jgi:hypothetical protein